MKSKFEWDGEKIKQTQVQTEFKHTPKEIIDSIHNVENQINQMENQKEQLKGSLKQIENNLVSAKDFKKQLKSFEEKCRELQIEKLKHLIGIIKEECKAKAEADAKEIIGKDPNAMIEEQKKQLPYLNYQKLLATHPKVAEKISQHIIRECLFEKPVFDNPFKSD